MQLQNALRRRRRSELRVNGPNAEGFFAAATGLRDLQSAVDPEQGFTTQPAGAVAVVSQSGGLGFALLNRGRELGLTSGRS